MASSRIKVNKRNTEYSQKFLKRSRPNNMRVVKTAQSMHRETNHKHNVEYEQLTDTINVSYNANETIEYGAEAEKNRKDEPFAPHS